LGHNPQKIKEKILKDIKQNITENKINPTNTFVGVDALVMLPCQKRTYKTRKGAKWFGRIFKQYYYRCSNCGHYHLTKKKQAKQTFLMARST